MIDGANQEKCWVLNFAGLKTTTIRFVGVDRDKIDESSQFRQLLMSIASTCVIKRSTPARLEFSRACLTLLGSI